MKAKYRIRIKVEDGTDYFFFDSWLWCKLTLLWFKLIRIEVIMQYRK